MKSLAKIEAEKMDLGPVKFHFLDFLNTIGEIIRVRAQQHGISFSCELLSDIPSGVYADETRLRQVLLNLLGNAVKFTNEGGVTLKVGYEAEDRSPAETASLTTGQQSSVAEGTNQRTRAKIRFQVEDTGIGIPPEKQVEIFLPFRQGGDKQTQAAGTGLGLAISRRLVQMMGGELRVESPPPGRERAAMGGPGSRFWFEIDLPEVVLDPIPAKVEKRNIIGYTPPVSEKKKALKVLIVDDQPENRLVLRDVLLPLGFDVREATNGHAALTGAKEFQPDLILMDLLLPEMDGFEATKQIRQMSELKDTIILAVSASAFEETRQKSLAAGCDDYFTKPFQVDEILDRLQAYLHLEWVYEEDNNTQSSPANQTQGPIVPPPATTLTSLHALVSIGYLDELQKQVTKLRAADAKFVPFATKIQQLAAEFRLDDLQGFIEHYLEGQDD